MVQKEAEGCCRDEEGEPELTHSPALNFADHQAKGSFVTLLGLVVQRSSPTEQTLLPFAVFISTQLF